MSVKQTGKKIKNAKIRSRESTDSEFRKDGQTKHGSKTVDKQECRGIRKCRGPRKSSIKQNCELTNSSEKGQENLGPKNKAGQDSCRAKSKQ